MAELTPKCGVSTSPGFSSLQTAIFWGTKSATPKVQSVRLFTVSWGLVEDHLKQQRGPGPDLYRFLVSEVTHGVRRFRSAIPLVADDATPIVGHEVPLVLVASPGQLHGPTSLENS